MRKTRANHLLQGDGAASAAADSTTCKFSDWSQSKVHKPKNGAFTKSPLKEAITKKNSTFKNSEGTFTSGETEKTRQLEKPSKVHDKGIHDKVHMEQRGVHMEKRGAFAVSYSKKDCHVNTRTVEVALEWGCGKGSPVYFLMEAVRASSMGHGFCSLSSSNPKFASDYLEKVTEYLQKKHIAVSTEAISAKLRDLAALYGTGEADFERCEVAVMRSQAAGRHDRIWMLAKGNARETTDGPRNAGPGSVSRLSLDLAPQQSPSAAAPADAVAAAAPDTGDGHAAGAAPTGGDTTPPTKR